MTNMTTNQNSENESSIAAKAAAVSEQAKAKLRAAGQGASEVVDNATTRAGKAIVAASDTVASAGRYLEDTHPSAMVQGANQSLTDTMRAHPRMTIGLGFAAGFLLARALRK
tara:strand:+ start:29541 stop:29876 length:336 start_codon:yes stop_codon:yes gene_type:complete